MFYQVDPYEVVSILIETLLYGAFLVLFVLSTVLLLQRRKAILNSGTAGNKAKWRNLTFYLVMSILMFCTITAVSCLNSFLLHLMNFALVFAEMVFLLAGSAPHSKT